MERQMAFSSVYFSTECPKYLPSAKNGSKPVLQGSPSEKPLTTVPSQYALEVQLGEGQESWGRGGGETDGR